MKKQRVSVAEGILTVEYPTIKKTFTADLSKYKQVIQDCARIHGYKQKFGDASSGGSPEEKFAEVQEIHASLLAGEWERTASIDLTPITCLAVSRLLKQPLKKVEEAAARKPEKVNEWRADAQVKAEIAKIRAEKAAELAKDSKPEDLKIDL